MNLFKLKPIPEVSLSTVVRPSSPNTYFVCPQGFSTSPPDQIAPVFPKPVNALYSAWQSLASKQPNTVELAHQSSKDFQITHVQRTSLLGFPDVITTELLAGPGNTSTLAIYSRSQYGHSDFGANRKRVTSWLAQLAELVG